MICDRSCGRDVPEPNHFKSKHKYTAGKKSTLEDDFWLGQDLGCLRGTLNGSFVSECHCGAVLSSHVVGAASGHAVMYSTDTFIMRRNTAVQKYIPKHKQKQAQVSERDAQTRAIYDSFAEVV